MTAAPLPREGLPRAAHRRLIPGAAMLWAERAFAAELGWAVAAWLVFAAAGLLGAFTLVPGAVRLALLAALVVFSVGAAVRAAVRLALPRRAEVLSRLDKGGGLSAGTSSFLDSSPVRPGGAFEEIMWQRARRDAAGRPVRLGLPRPSLPRPLAAALVAALAALALGLLVSGREAPERLAQSFSPWPVPLSAYAFRVEITPPDYAAAQVRLLELAGDEVQPLEVLAGSRLKITPASELPSWTIFSPSGVEVRGSAFIPEVEGRWRLASHGRTLAALQIEVAADGDPVVRFDGDPVRSASGALSFGYRLTDDHGALDLSLEVSGGAAEPRVYDLVEAARPGSGRVFADLTSDPRAGERARLTLIARDGAGNVGRSPPLVVPLPVKTFTDPVAAEIIAARKMLLEGGPRRTAVRRLSKIAAAPDRFDERTDIFAGLRSATWRLLHDRRPTTRGNVADILWDVAADLEDGGTSRAMEDLRAAMERLAKEAGSGDDELLAALTKQLESAMAEYLRRQVEAALAAGETPQAEALESLASTVDMGFLEAMMADLKDRLAAGDTEGAMQALANLRGLMESIQFGSAAPDPAAAERAQALQDLAAQLGEAEAQERALRDETIAEAVRQMIRDDPDAAAELQARQQQVGAATERIEEQLRALGADAPDELGQARQAMQRASQALERGDLGAAAQAQTQALRRLGEAGEAMRRQAQQMANQAAGGAMQPGASGSGIDPLGRPGRDFGQGSVNLPDEQRLRRVQEIRALLEERAADPSRSEEERSYYLRLLKRF